MMPFAELWDRLVSVLFPKRCVLCQQPVAYDDIWCGCTVKNSPVGQCAICYALDCHCVPHSFQWVHAPFVYEGAVKQGLLHLKHYPEPRTVDFFVQYMLPLVEDEISACQITSVTCVPMQASVYNKKGFNHADLLAGALANALSLPYYPKALTRDDRSLAQKSLNQSQRMENALASFRGGKTSPLPNGAALLVDDICTSGATLEACSQQLVALGATAVYCVTAAHSTLENHT